MSHSYEAREAARREISRLVALAERHIARAMREGELEAIDRIMQRRRRSHVPTGLLHRYEKDGLPFLSSCGFSLGGSRCTKELRDLAAELRGQRLGRLEPELAYLRRKIQRTIRHFGFNDIEIRF